MFQHNVGDLSANESLLYHYWSVILLFLEKGLPWTYIEDMTPAEVSLVLAMLAAKADRENELQSKSMRV